jgi:hypothetical protein
MCISKRGCLQHNVTTYFVLVLHFFGNFIALLEAADEWQRHLLAAGLGAMSELGKQWWVGVCAQLCLHGLVFVHQPAKACV